MTSPTFNKWTAGTEVAQVFGDQIRGKHGEGVSISVYRHFSFARPSQYWSQPLSVPVSTQEITAKQKKEKGKKEKKII